jgi:4,5-DOPA dioxygenase extradiol
MRETPGKKGKAMTRRESLGMLIAGAAAVAGGKDSTLPASGKSDRTKRGGASGRMPAIFLAHGAPPLLDMAEWVGELNSWAGTLPRPRSILMLSAHWEERPVTLGATRTVPLVYDFYGFPERYYQQKYEAPGAPELADRVRGLLSPTQPVASEPDRGLDHGAYVPLVAMYPNADIPVLQVSLPSLDPKELFALGRALAPLRDEGVLLVGSGFITHNLRRAVFAPDVAVPTWATEFDEWVAQALSRKDADALIDFESRGPGARIALPTTEHYVPLLVALGSAIDEKAPVQFPITGFVWGPFTRRSVQFG